MHPSSISVWALPQNPLGKCYPDPLAGFKGPTSKGRDETGREERSEEGMEGKGDTVQF